MVVDRPDLEPMASATAARAARRSVVDGVLAGRGDVWIVVARPGEDPASFLREPEPGGRGARICRAVLPDGTLVMAESDPESDPLLSEMRRGGPRGLV